MVSVVGNNFHSWPVAIVHNAEDRIGAVAIGNPADFVVVPLGPQIVWSAVHCSTHDGFGLSRKGEVAVAGRDLQLVAEIPPVAHSVEPWQDEIQDWQEPLVRRTVARQLIREGLYGHGWHSGSVQEKGWLVKYGLPLADGALFGGHPKFSLGGTAALFTASSIQESGLVPQIAAFADIQPLFQYFRFD